MAHLEFLGYILAIAIVIFIYVRYQQKSKR